jgi:hypothetical protein
VEFFFFYIGLRLLSMYLNTIILTKLDFDKKKKKNKKKTKKKVGNIGNHYQYEMLLQVKGRVQETHNPG